MNSVVLRFALALPVLVMFGVILAVAAKAGA
jgi:hypothetical protein